MRETCPRCHRPAGVPIVYGEPSVELYEASLRGEVVLAGCVVTDDDAGYECSNCGFQFGSREDVERSQLDGD